MKTGTTAVAHKISGSLKRDFHKLLVKISRTPSWHRNYPRLLARKQELAIMLGDRGIYVEFCHHSF